MVLATVYFGLSFMHRLEDAICIHISGGKSLTSVDPFRSVMFEVSLLRQIIRTRDKDTWCNGSRTLGRWIPKMRFVEEEQNTTHQLMATAPPFKSCLGIDRRCSLDSTCLDFNALRL